MPGETTNYKFGYPLEAEAPDGALQIKTLAEELDAEKWLSRSVKLTAGRKISTEGLALSGSLQEIPGLKLEITPAVASTLLIWGTLSLESGSSGKTQIKITLNVDGSDIEEGQNVVIIAENERLQIPFSYAPALTAAPHTIKVRAERLVGTAGAIRGFGESNFLYQLVAS